MQTTVTAHFSSRPYSSYCSAVYIAVCIVPAVLNNCKHAFSFTPILAIFLFVSNHVVVAFKYGHDLVLDNVVTKSKLKYLVFAGWCIISLYSL